jgi:hypothetical protein
MTTEIAEDVPSIPLAIKNGGYANSGLTKKEYENLHYKMKKKILKPELCQFCFKASPYDLVNIHGIYNEEEVHWCWGCRSCHVIYDHMNGTRAKPCGDRNPMYGVHRFGEESPMFDKKHTDETRPSVL